MSNVLRELLVKLGFEVEGKGLENANAKTNDWLKSVKGLATFVGGSYVKSKIDDFIGGLKETAAELKAGSIRSGMSIQEWQRWSTAANFAGVSAEALGTGIKFLQKNAVEAKDSGGEAAKEFAKLHVQFKDANGQVRSSSELFLDTATAIGEMSNPAERTAAAMKLFGRQGTELLPFFAKGREGIKELTQKLDEFGGGLSDDALGKLRDSSKATKEFDLALLSLKSAFASQLIPWITQAIRTKGQMVLKFLELAKGSNIFKAALIVVGAIAVKTAVTIYASYLPLIALIGVLVLLIDDIITAFKGGDSLVGRFLDKILGAGAAKDIFGGIKKQVLDLVYTWDHAGDDLGDKIEAVVSIIGGRLGDIGEMFAEAAGYLWADIKPEIQEFGNWMNKAAFNSAAEFIQGMIDGLLAGVDKVIDAASDVAHKVISAVKGAWDSHSPSKVAIGLTRDGWIGGMVNAMKDGEGDVEAAAQGTARAAQYAPAFRAKGGFGGGPVQLTQQNTFTTTVDASGGNGGSIANQVRDGQRTALNDANNAMVYDLETLAPSST